MEGVFYYREIYLRNVYIYNMEQIDSADDLQQAEVIAFNHVRKNFTNKAGYVTFPIEHTVEVLINHRGKIPIHSPNGWKFSFVRENVNDEWRLELTEEY